MAGTPLVYGTALQKECSIHIYQKNLTRTSGAQRKDALLKHMASLQQIYIAYKVRYCLTTLQASPVHKLLGNFSATSGFSRNFHLVEQLPVHRASFKFLCLDSHSHAPATSQALKKCRILLVSRIYICPIF